MGVYSHFSVKSCKPTNQDITWSYEGNRMKRTWV